jgi:hypothetical protein
MPCVPPPLSPFPSDRSRGEPREATSIGCRAIFPGACKPCIGRANEELDNRDTTVSPAEVVSSRQAMSLHVRLRNSDKGFGSKMVDLTLRFCVFVTFVTFRSNHEVRDAWSVEMS